MPRGPGKSLAPRGSAILVFLRLVALGATVLLVGEAARALVASPRFAVRRVEIQAEPVLAKELAKRLELRPGTSLVLANTGKLTREVKALALVESARVYRRWPDRIVVSAEARKAAAVCRTGKKGVFYDAEGWPFAMPGEWGWELPELVGPDLSAPPGHPEGPRSAARLLLSCLEELGEHGGVKLRRLRLDEEGRVTAELASGTEVRLGQPEEMELKAGRLRSSLTTLAGKEEAEYIDLSSPYGVVWKPREGPVVRERLSSPSG